MHLAIVIITYRTPGLAEDCLHSLRREREAGIHPHVVLVDRVEEHYYSHHRTMFEDLRILFRVMARRFSRLFKS